MHHPLNPHYHSCVPELPFFFFWSITQQKHHVTSRWHPQCMLIGRRPTGVSPPARHWVWTQDLITHTELLGFSETRSCCYCWSTIRLGLVTIPPSPAVLHQVPGFASKPTIMSCKFHTIMHKRRTNLKMHVHLHWPKNITMCASENRPKRKRK